MGSKGYVGPPRLLKSEAFVPDSGSEDRNCTLRLTVENKSEGEPAEYDILMQPNTLDAVIASFEKIKNQLQLLTENQAES